MADTAKLRDMLQDLINDNPAQAQINLHDYLVDKMRDVAGTAPASFEENDEIDSSTDEFDVGSGIDPEDEE